MIEYALFQRLPAWSQAEALVRYGTALAQRQHNDWTVTLYVLDNRFVELWAKNGLSVTTSFRAEATTLEIAEPYLEQMDITPLLNT
ncbi:hypothetical protein MKJ04_05005 [Pontibacter sp. E15-1]|uniref:hypothetical protein n=1 Tax=Pontibacter sp. E15-1 TaxID=2919918 RepID=UPI001F5033BF|nr:hypothetical protein [Pontibacter sp. E15-1]MCJ8164191.1 hypothetical protein [Pontibacter sp. E15-1]